MYVHLQAPTEITRVYPHNRKLFPLKESAKKEEAESVNDVPSVTPAEKQTNEDDNHLPVVQHSTSANQSKVPTETIDPLTLSIVPHKQGKGQPREDHMTLQNGMNENRLVAHINSDDPQNQTPSSSVPASTSEPVDLMMFSITPAAITKMTTSSPHSGMAMQPPATRQDLSKAAGESLSSDLIEFSISPSLLGNAHNSQIQFGATDKQQSHQQELFQTYPPKVKPKQSPEPHRASRSPEPSHGMQINNSEVSPHQNRYEAGNERAADKNTSEYPQAVSQFQRQSSFPFQNKQPATPQRDGIKSEVQAIPQSSDFAGRFRGYNALEGDQLNPNWEHFGAENTRDDSSKSLSVSPEAWTVLNTAGDEEATFKSSRQFAESYECKSEEIKYTPAITSLKRVSLQAPEHVKSGNSIVNRPLPSVPHSSVDNGRGTLALSLPTAELSTGSNTVRFSTQHHSTNRGIGASQASSRTDSTSKKADLIYVDPDKLVFSKPADSQPQLSYPANRPPYNTSYHSSGEVNIAGPSNASKNNKRKNYVDVESGGSKSDSAPLVTLHDQNVGTKANLMDPTDAERTCPNEDVGGTSSASAKPATYSSPPITADPLYAIPEKLKRKLLTQEASHPAHTSANDTVSTGSTTDTAHSSSDDIMKATDTSTSAKSITGADYLSSLLQERQSARQQSSATATTPTGDLLEASSKARASSQVETSLTSSSESESISHYDKLRPITGKEYLQELLQKRKQTQSSGMSGLCPVSTSAGQRIGDDPLYAVPEKPKIKSGVAQTERHLNEGTNDVSGGSQSIRPSIHASTAVSRGQVPKQNQNRAQNDGKQASKEHISTTVASSAGPQKMSSTRECSEFSTLSLSLSLSLSC